MKPVPFLFSGPNWLYGAFGGKIVPYENDENTQALLKDPLHVPVGPITRARSKKIKAALNGLIQDIWAEIGRASCRERV